MRYYLKIKNIEAIGEYMDGKMTIVKGSHASKSVKSSLSDNYTTIRNDLRSKGILIEDGEFLVFTNNYLCNSPSAASNIICGSSTNGFVLWKNEDGKTLKKILAQDE